MSLTEYQNMSWNRWQTDGKCQWRACDKKEENKELMTAVESNDIQITWHYAPAHSGRTGNEKADKSTVQAATKE